RLASAEESARLLSLCFALLCRISCDSSVATPIRALVLHSLFTAIYALSSRAATYARELLDLALALLPAAEAAIRMGALKLLGVTLPHAEAQRRAEPPLLLQIRTALSAMAAMDEESDVQQLANKLLTLSGLAQ